MFQRASVQLLFVIAISAAVLFVNLGTAQLWDRDEPRNAGCAAEMMQRGDWIVPMFNDELRFQKPVLLYWLMGSAYAMFGVNEFAARFWSAVLAAATVAMTYLIGRRLFNPSAAFIGSIALATSLMFVVAGRAATPDSLLIFCQTLALTIYVCGTFAAKKQSSDAPKLRQEGKFFPSSNWVVAAMYAAMGLGVLAKGLIGIVMPMAIIGLFMLIETQPSPHPRWSEGYGKLFTVLANIVRPFGPRHFFRTFLRMKPLWAMAMVLIIAGPWFALVGFRTEGDFLRLFFIDEHLGRATTTLENHGGGIWYYPLAILIGFFPWSIFLVPMLLGIDRRLSKGDPLSSAFVFLICWAGVQVGIFSFVSTKLPSYVTPCYPALALVCGFCLERLSRDKNRLPIKLEKAIFVALGVTGIAISAGLAVVCVRFLRGDYWLIGLGGVWLAVALAGWFALDRRGWRQWTMAFSVAAIAFSIGLFGFGTVSVGKLQQASQIFEPLRGRQVPIATFRCLESSWIYYSQQPIFELATSERGADPTADRPHYWQRKPRLLPAEFARLHPDAVFITTDQAWFELQQQLPDHYRIVETAPYFLRDKNLLLVAPVDVTQSASRRRPSTLIR